VHFLDAKVSNNSKGGESSTENILNERTHNHITMNTSILCDFDGTITTTDTCVHVLSHFADGDWEAYDDKLLEGKIGLEECMQLQFQMVKASRRDILLHLQEIVSIRDGFKDFVDNCLKKSFSFIVISGGLDFVIRHFLNLQGLGSVEVISGKTSIRDNGIEFEFPRKRFDDSVDFKADFVRHHKRIGFKVVYIGDGLSDFQAVREADVVFVVKGSRLADRCREQNLACIEFTSFREIQIL
jgi:2-hydroxy-3-keto-5-methylthiopentenyl-1-phosphate phosphatase